MFILQIKFHNSVNCFKMRGKIDRDIDESFLPNKKIKDTRIIDVPSCSHERIIGKRGSNLRAIQLPRTIMCLDRITSKLMITGPKDDVNIVANRVISQYIKYYEAHIDMNIDSKFVPYIVGAKGANIKLLQQRTGVEVRIKNNIGHTHIHIHGTNEGVLKARNQIDKTLKMLEKQQETKLLLEKLAEDPTVCSISINPSAGCYDYFVRQNGINFSNLQDQFSMLAIENIDREKTIKITGPKDEVNKACAEINSTYIDNYIKFDVTVDATCMGKVIGKYGRNIKYIQAQTGIQIKNKSDGFQLEGLKDDVLKAKDMIKTIEHGKVIDDRICISTDLYTFLMNFEEVLIAPLVKKYNEVQISFLTGSDNVDIDFRGYKSLVKNVINEFMLLLDRYNDYIVESVELSAEDISWLKTENVRRKVEVIGDSTGAEISLPSSVGDHNVIIVGKRNFALSAKAELLSFVEGI